MNLNNNKSKKIMVATIIILLVIISMATFVVIQIGPYNKNNKEDIVVDIPTGSTLNQVTDVLKENKLYGYNTDYFGFGYMLKVSNIDIKDKIAVILGNGGASRAVVHYLVDNNVKEVYLVSRNPNKNDFSLENVKLISYGELESLKGNILINATPVGMYPNTEESPVTKEIISNFDALVDLIYNPMETKFLSYGKELNKINVGGLYMLIGQAAKAQEVWQGTNISEAIIEKIYNKINKKFL